jgi:hypothetical protein
MTTINSLLRAALAVLCLGLLAACGGGEDDSVPAGAKVCELRQTKGGLPFPTFDVYATESFRLPLRLLDGQDSVDGRYHITSADGSPFYVRILPMSQSTPSGATSLEGVVDSDLSLAPDLSYDMTFSQILGMKDGMVMLGGSSDAPFNIGTWPPTRDYRGDDVLGLAEKSAQHLSSPALFIEEPEGVLRVAFPFSPGTIWPHGASFIISVQQFAYRATPDSLIWGCQMEGVVDEDLRVVLRGQPPEKFQWYINVYATVTLDDGRRALSRGKTYVIER